MKDLTKLVCASLLLGCTTAPGQVILADNYDVSGNGSGFALDAGLNTGINPPTTRMTGTVADGLRYMNRTSAQKPDTSYLISGTGKFRVNSGAQSGRVSFSPDGTSAFNFANALGISGASAAQPVEYEITISMDNNAASTQRFSLGLGTVETSAVDWDFGLQLHKAADADTFYTVSKRIDTASSGIADLNAPMFVTAAGTAGTEVSFLIRVTDAGAESSTFSSRVRVSLDNGSSWAYDTDQDSALVNGFRFDGANRFISFDVAGGNSSFVTYDNFSLKLVPEPGFAGFALLGGLGLLLRRRLA